ncbi:MAG: hypothetical protein M3R68_07810, partial [Acidobacteriota bacterium]|nr:hypothetical protein [Acidobacteriota bacterium]
MKDEGGRMKGRRTGGRGDAETRGRGGARNKWHLTISVVLIVLASGGCALRASRQGVPPEVAAVVTTVGEDSDEGRYEKIY